MVVSSSNSIVVTGFLTTTTTTTTRRQASIETYLQSNNDDHDNENNRRSFLTTASSAVVATSFGLFSSIDPVNAAAEAEEESFASIAERASKLSNEVGEKTYVMTANDGDTRTAYDFDLPVAGETISFKDIVRQSVNDDGYAKVKAILVVNMKEDDPFARKGHPRIHFVSI